jgi:hypothetical protein
MTIEVVDYLTHSPFGNVDVSVCERQDVTCGTPRAHGTANAAGRVVLSFSNPTDPSGRGFDGYVLLQSPEIVTWLRYWDFPLSEAAFKQSADNGLAGTGQIGVLTPVEFAQYLQSLGATLDPMEGSLVVNAIDCNTTAAPGVVFTTTSSSKATRTYYAFSSTATATDSTGIAAIGPVPPGIVDVTATPISLMKPASVVRGLVVLPNAVTAATLFPTP